VAPTQPQHITMTTMPEAGYLRRKDVRGAVRQAMLTSMAFSKKREQFRICHLSIQGSHIHLIAEADSKDALSRGMQGFTIACAKHINGALSSRLGVRRTGRVFADRYHARALRTPAQVRNCLSYVLNNWRHHGRGEEPVTTRLDPYATGIAFSGWADLTLPFRLSADMELLPVWFPRVWLLREGWRRHGLISSTEVPG
jgi:REP element-mobilizing transposase RayT